MKRGYFLTLEGPDGCGKSTQSRLLAERLKKMGLSFCLTREPGGTAMAEALRKIILNPNFHVAPLTEILLYEASRAQHTAEVILPALKAKKIVVCDRYADATTAYQGYGRNLDLKMVRSLNAIATGGLKPDLTVCLDVSPRVGLERAGRKGKDRMENERLSFHAKVRQGYMAIAKSEPERVRVVSGMDPIEMVQEKIWKLVSGKLKI